MYFDFSLSLVKGTLGTVLLEKSCYSLSRILRQNQVNNYTHFCCVVLFGISVSRSGACSHYLTFFYETFNMRSYVIMEDAANNLDNTFGDT